MPHFELDLCCLLPLPLWWSYKSSFERTYATANTPLWDCCPPPHPACTLRHPRWIYNSDKTPAQGSLQLRAESIARDGSELPAKDYTPSSLITSYADQQVLNGRQRHFSLIPPPPSPPPPPLFLLFVWFLERQEAVACSRKLFLMGEDYCNWWSCHWGCSLPTWPPGCQGLGGLLCLLMGCRHLG